jgi:hypothetical protein
MAHCSKFVVSTTHSRRELVNLQKLSPLQEIASNIKQDACRRE